MSFVVSTINKVLIIIWTNPCNCLNLVITPSTTKTKEMYHTCQNFLSKKNNEVNMYTVCWETMKIGIKVLAT